MNAEMFINCCKARDKAHKKQEGDNMMEKLKRFDEVATIFAYGIISEWTDDLGLCLYAVAEMIDKLVCDFDKVQFMDYSVEGDYIYIEHGYGKSKLYLGHDNEGHSLKEIVIAYTDLISNSKTFYKYKVGTEFGSSLVELDCVEKKAEGVHMIYYVESGKAKVKRNDYTYEIIFKNDRIQHDECLREHLIDTFFQMRAYKANDIIQGLIYKFAITEEEFAQMGDVSAKVNDYGIYMPFSQVCYHNGERGQAIFGLDDDVYPLKFS